MSQTASSVGIRELKAHLSRYLTLVKKGERITVSDRGRAVAIISPVPKDEIDERIEAMLRAGLAKWNGGKPRGLEHRIRLKKGPPLSETILKDRR
jgi:prevent-host-death family protein